MSLSLRVCIASAAVAFSGVVVEAAVPSEKCNANDGDVCDAFSVLQAKVEERNVVKQTKYEPAKHHGDQETTVKGKAKRTIVATTAKSQSKGLSLELLESSRGIDDDDDLYLAKVCEMTELFKDMLSHMKRYAIKKGVLNVEARELLSTACRGATGGLYNASLTLSSIVTKEEARGSAKAQVVKAFDGQIIDELVQICHIIIGLVDQLSPKTQDVESKIFYHKMKGDYLSKVAMFSIGYERDAAKTEAASAYDYATARASERLKTTHPLRLSLALNSAKFHSEVMHDPTRAAQIANSALQEAFEDIDQLDDDVYLTVTDIMQELRDFVRSIVDELDDM